MSAANRPESTLPDLFSVQRDCRNARREPAMRVRLSRRGRLGCYRIGLGRGTIKFPVSRSDSTSSDPSKYRLKARTWRTSGLEHRLPQVPRFLA